MSYTPGTKLSHSDACQRATVLTGDNVMVTYGLGVGQMMKFADWQILADGANIQEVVAPVKEDIQANIDHAAARWASLDAATRWVIPMIGAKLRWTLKPNTYRVAIMTTKGVLEVKSIDEINGVLLKKTMFKDDAAWRASLPAGGSVDVLQPSKIVEAQTTDAVYSSLSDIEKVNALMKRYKIRDRVQEMQSTHERLSDAVNLVNISRDKLRSLTLQEHLNIRGLYECSHLKRVMEYHRQRKKWFDAAVLSKCDVHKHELRDMRYGTGHILATIHGVKNIIVTFQDKIAAIPYSPRWSNATTYNSFAEMGNPALSVVYRTHTINV